MQVRVVTADGESIERTLPGGGGENPACANAEKPEVDTTENPRSLGTVITFGKLRILDLGDLTADKEMPLICPVNKIGHVDIYVVSHHGSEPSGSAALVHGIAPRVAIMDNGAKKGGSPPTWDVIEKSPGLEDLWQLHYSEEGGEAHNVAAPFLANLQGPDTGNYLKVTASVDGSFEVFNSRTRATKKYGPRK
jgi:competence protein ComEC